MKPRKTLSVFYKHKNMGTYYFTNRHHGSLACSWIEQRKDYFSPRRQRPCLYSSGSDGMLLRTCSLCPISFSWFVPISLLCRSLLMSLYILSSTGEAMVGTRIAQVTWPRRCMRDSFSITSHASNELKTPNNA